MQALRRPLLSQVRKYSFSASFSTSSGQMTKRLRIGFVPVEHFSTPIHFAQSRFGLDADLIPYPSGTGHMVQSLKSKEIDIGIGLTEGWVAGLGKEKSKKDYAYKIVGTYVETPLCWAISTGVNRSDINNIKDLENRKIGVSRVGSGSYVMGFVLADQQGWLDAGSADPPFEVIVLNDFKRLREGVNSSEADFFMWETFTSKRYYDNGEIKRAGEIYTPWSSWKIVAREPEDTRLNALFDSINRGVEYFNGHKDEAVEYISTHLDYSAEDAREWLKTVEFAKDVRGVDNQVVRKTVDILSKAGVLEKDKAEADDMVAFTRR